MAQRNSRILLVIFFVSVSIIPMVEIGHDFLHTFKNPFHYHQTGHKSFASHTLSDHHKFGKMKFAYLMEEEAHLDNLVWFAYQFSSSSDVFSYTQFGFLLKHEAKETESYYCVHSSPPTPPPLAIFFI